MRTPHIIACSIVTAGTLLLPAASAQAAPAAVSAQAAPAASQPLRLQQAAFTSPQRGYGLFTLLGSTVCRAEVAATADGGARFGRPHVAARWSCDGNDPVTRIAADKAGDVFVFGPALAVSHDHGRSWTPARVGDVLALSAVGRSVWLLTARCTGHGTVADRCPVRLLVSADGGRSWRRARLPGATVAGFGSQVVGQADLVRTSKAAGYVLTGPGVNPRGKPDVARIWITGNGGASWARHAVPCGLDALSAALAVAPTGRIFVACASEPGAGSQAKALASSLNGSTWTVRTPCSHGTIVCPPLSFGYLSQIAATSDGTVFLVGPRSSLLVTHSAGRTWRAVKPLIGDDGGGTSTVSFFGPRGIVVGNDPANDELPAIWHTADGGAHWHVVHPAIP
jgi:photosystem II stability/assembly factor-like uncharacterized protein